MFYFYFELTEGYCPY